MRPCIVPSSSRSAITSAIAAPTGSRVVSLPSNDRGRVSLARAWTAQQIRHGQDDGAAGSPGDTRPRCASVFSYAAARLNTGSMAS